MSAERSKPCSTILYLIRHADCRQDDVKRYIGQVDLPLNKDGVQQAMFLARTMKDVPISRIYCSDLKRSYDTARIIAADRHELICPVPALREINLGQWDGLAMAEIHQRYPEEYRKRGIDLVNFHPPAGESFHDLAIRIIPQFNKLMDASRGHEVMVGHAGVNRVILCHILGMPMDHIFRLQQDYGGMNIIEKTHDGMRLLSMNTTSFAEQ